MIQIFVDSQEAMIKKETSFDFVSENRLFSGADDFSFEIVFPLVGCTKNQKIFGVVNKSDVSLNKAVLDCEFFAKGIHKKGALAITQITDAEVKGQFLGGRSAQNFHTSLDDLYINELDLGLFPTVYGREQDPTHDVYEVRNGFYAFPWWNESKSKLENEMNMNDLTPGRNYGGFKNQDKKLSLFIPLATLVHKIARALGYTIANREEFNSQKMVKNMVVCNTTILQDYTGNDTTYWAGIEYHISSILPHWTATEFFEKLEMFTGGTFIFNDVTKTITHEIVKRPQKYHISQVLDSYSYDVDTEEQSESSYIGCSNVAYADGGHSEMYRYNCEWFVDKSPKMLEKLKVIEVANMQTMIQKTKNDIYRLDNIIGSDLAYNIIYVKSIDCHFLVTPFLDLHQKNGAGGWQFRIVTVNEFGDRKGNTGDKKTELSFVPVCVKYCKDIVADIISIPYDTQGKGAGDTTDKKYNLNPAYAILKRGKPEDRPTYYDKIYIGYVNSDFWRDETYHKYFNYAVHPIASNILLSHKILQDVSYTIEDFNLRHNDKSNNTKYCFYDIDPSRKYSFSFLSDEMPDVNSLFIINGNGYICEKLTATISEDGLSPLIKGVFYKVID